MQIIECMILLAFFGAKNCEETENSMQRIWELIHKIPVSTVSPTVMLTFVHIFKLLSLLICPDGSKLISLLG